MSKVQTNVNDLQLMGVQMVAIKNGKSKTKIDSVNLAIDIASSAIKHLDDDTFEQITGLKK